VHSHGAVGCGAAHHVGCIAEVGRIPDIAIGESDIDVAESFRGIADFGKRGLARTGSTR
jgi:hypothetical protein